MATQKKAKRTFTRASTKPSPEKQKPAPKKKAVARPQEPLPSPRPVAQPVPVLPEAPIQVESLNKQSQPAPVVEAVTVPGEQAAVSEEQASPKDEAASPAQQPASSAEDGWTDTTTDNKPAGGSSLMKKIFFMLVVIVITAVVVSAGLFLFAQRSQQEKENLAKSKETSEQEATPTAVPTEAKKDKTKFSLKILNGSGIPGEAAKLQKILEKDEFTVDSVGNADASTYKETLVAAKKAVDKTVLSELTKVLGDNTFVASNAAALKETDETDIVITIGSKRTE